MILEPELTSIAVGLGTAALLHLGLWRAAPSPEPRMGGLAAIGAFGTAASAVTHVSIGGLDSVSLAIILWADLFVVTAYLFLYAGICRSVSVLIMTRLRREYGGSVLFDDLVKGYAAERQFADRIALMEAKGLVRFKGEAVLPTARGRALGRAAKILGGILGRGLEG